MGLVTLSDMKTYLGVSGGSEDAYLTSEIDLISSIIENFCRRKFESKQYKQTWYKDTLTKSYLLTYHYPVITIDTIDADAFDDEVYRIHKPSGRIEGLYRNCFWGGDDNKIEVIYTAGYATVPLEIQYATKVLVQDRYLKKNSGVALDFGSNIQSVTIPGTITIAYDYNMTDDDANNSFGSILSTRKNLIAPFKSDRAILGSGERVYLEEL